MKRTEHWGPAFRGWKREREPTREEKKERERGRQRHPRRQNGENALRRREWSAMSKAAERSSDEATEGSLVTWTRGVLVECWGQSLIGTSSRENGR